MSRISSDWFKKYVIKNYRTFAQVYHHLFLYRIQKYYLYLEYILYKYILFLYRIQKSVTISMIL